MASREISDLDPQLQHLARALLARCRGAGIDVLIYCTFRSGIEQDAEYAKGRTRPGKIVTWARAGQSQHNVMSGGLPAARAFDCAPLRNGRIVWGTSGDGIDDDPSDDHTDDLELWQRVGVIGRSLGLEWAGDWPKPKREFPHFQLPKKDTVMSPG